MTQLQTQNIGQVNPGGFFDKPLQDLKDWAWKEIYATFRGKPGNAGETFGLLQKNIEDEINKQYPNAKPEHKKLLSDATTLIIGERLIRTIKAGAGLDDIKKSFTDWKNNNRDILGNANHLVSKVRGNVTTSNKINTNLKPSNVVNVLGTHFGLKKAALANNKVNLLKTTVWN
jgi:hypothetical protein